MWYILLKLMIRKGMLVWLVRDCVVLCYVILYFVNISETEVAKYTAYHYEVYCRHYHTTYHYEVYCRHYHTTSITAIDWLRQYLFLLLPSIIVGGQFCTESIAKSEKLSFCFVIMLFLRALKIFLTSTVTISNVTLIR